MAAVPLETERSTFPAEVAFQGVWRSYQARLLERLDAYLEDRRVHIVAAPGSGKTVFGLEVVRRVNQRTLVLAPTITIRDQWAERLMQQFLPAGSPRPDWLSTNIRDPRLLTVATYQALHALLSGEAEITEDSAAEEENGSIAATDPGIPSGNGNDKPADPRELPPPLAAFKTLVVDEAHHLKAEWWKSLTFVADRLKPTVIALTATPPYDVSPYEWQRYVELCGPVDAEVPVPELVLHGDLSPHQDYVYFSLPAGNEQKSLMEFRASVNAFTEQLLHDREFAAALAAHPWLTDPDSHLEEMLDHPEYLSSLLIYLQAAGAPVPQKVLRQLGTGSQSLPQLDLAWLEILLTRALYEDDQAFAAHDAVWKRLKHELLRMGAIERRRVVLRNPSNQARLLTSSTTKLKSIEEIVRIESNALKESLRCVILTDFIRKSDLPKSPGQMPEFEDIGAVPIFETLRSAAIPGVRLGVLCGSLVIIPESSRNLLLEIAAAVGIQPEDVVLRPLPHAPDDLQVEIRGTCRQGSVRLITSLLERGGLTVLVGTKALLGEGWDAPAVNTLILATFVGSYVSSNQMRGRSIRIDPHCPSKTANVWHLVCVEPGQFGPGEDYALLARRCEAFVGVSAASTAIENGVARLGLRNPPFAEQQIAAMNELTVDRAIDRDALRSAWTEALAKGHCRQMTDGLMAEAAALPRGFVLRNTIAALLIQAATLFAAIFIEGLRVLGRLRDQDPLTLLAALAAVAAVVSLPKAVVAVWRLLRHGTPERSMNQIGTALLETLRYEGSIGASSRFQIHAETNRGDGSVYCWTSGGTGREQAVFMRALREVLRPVENPRYLLARSRVWRFFQEDYFAVPDLLARKRELAEIFARKWSSRVGPVKLIYTRTTEGRKILLRARLSSLSAAFQKRAGRLSCWK